MLTISSQGEVELAAYTLLGASTKDESQIGRWGSGAKGAIAGLLRLGVKFHIFSGTTRLDFTTKKVNFRNEVFEQIVVNGQDTSITTRMHKDWQLVDCIRELYANARDEGDVTVSWDDQPIAGVPGRTTVFFNSTGGVDDLELDWSSLFLPVERKPTYVFGTERYRLEMFTTLNPRVYCKGIWVMEPQELALLRPKHSFNFENLWVREDRRSDMSSVHAALRYVATSCSKEQLKLLLDICFSCPENSFERLWVENHPKLITTIYQSPEYFSVLDCEIDAVPISQRASAIIFTNEEYLLNTISYGLKHYARWSRERSRNNEDLPHDFKQRLDAMVPYLKKLGFSCTAKHKYEDDDTSKVIAMAVTEDNSILWMPKAFKTSDADLFATYLEELVHIERDVRDCSREMQNVLFEMITNLSFKRPSFLDEPEQHSLTFNKGDPDGSATIVSDSAGVRTDYWF